MNSNCPRPGCLGILHREREAALFLDPALPCADLRPWRVRTCSVCGLEVVDRAPLCMDGGCPGHLEHPAREHAGVR